MADSKISTLPASTVPLAGTETLPIVQSGATKKVSVADLTAGRNVSTAGLTATPSGAFQSIGIGAGSTYGIISFNGVFGVNTSIGAAGGANGDNSFYLLSPSTIYQRIGSSNITRATSTGFDVQIGDLGLFNGNINQGTAAKGINFTANTGAAGMTSQLLNWYEEGTFTASLTASTAGPTTPVTSTAYYTRVGRLVTVTINFEGADTTGASGSLRISGLPFAANASSPAVAGAVTLAGFGSVVGNSYMTGGNTYFQFVEATTDNYIAMVAGTGKTVRTTFTYFI